MEKENKELKGKKKFYKKWWFWVIIVIVLLAIIGSDSPSNESNNLSNPTTTKQIPSTPSEPVIKVTASQLVKDYEANEVSADSKYKNKIIEVTGTIKTIGKDIMDQPYVSLDGSSSSLITDVQCMFEKSNQSQLESLSKDSKITLSGSVDGKLMNILIKGCFIIK